MFAVSGLSRNAVEALGPGMNTEGPLTEREDEVLRKVGRNLLLFQQIEGQLKTLLAHTFLEASTSPVAEKMNARRRHKIAAKTMGALVGQFTSEVLGPESPKPAAQNVEPPVVGFSASFMFSTHPDNPSVAAQAEALGALVDERNVLVHHFLATWDRKSIAGMQAASLHLDEQRERVIAQQGELRSTMESLQQGRQEILAFITSGEMARQFELAWLQGSSLVRRLARISRKAAKDANWVSIQDAEIQLRTSHGSEMRDLRRLFGYDSIASLIFGAQLFEVHGERFRVLSRPTKG